MSTSRRLRREIKKAQIPSMSTRDRWSIIVRLALLLLVFGSLVTAFAVWGDHLGGHYPSCYRCGRP